MEISLDSCYAKVKRAKETIYVLDKELNDLLESGKYYVERENQEEQQRYLFRLQGQKLSLQISIMAGEIIHHLRSVLDYLAWETASKSGKSFNERITFPIYSDQQKFKDAIRKKKLKGVPEKYQVFFESIQPYNTDSPKNSIIQIIHDLDVLDKHKLLVVVSHGIKMGNKIIIEGEPSAPITFIVADDGVFFTDIENGNETHWLNYETTGNSNWEIKNDFKVVFTFEEIGSLKRQNVVDVLNKGCNYIESVLNDFAKII